MKKILRLATLALVLGTLIGGCKKDDFVEIDGVCPMVVSTSPESNATGVPVSHIITATFNTEMNAATINTATFVLFNGTASVAGSVTYNDRKAFFTPTNALDTNTTYTSRILRGAKDSFGQTIQTDHVWNFSTILASGSTVAYLGTADRFGILAGVGISNDAGFSEIRDMDVGVYPGSRSTIVGFPPAIVVNGTIYAADDIAPAGVADMLNQAKTDLTNAYLYAEGAISPAPQTVSGDLGGTTLAPGIYKSTSSLLIQSGDLTLDGQGDVNATWIFQIASDFTTIGGAGGNVILIGGAQAKNIFWQTGSSATIGDYTAFQGNVLALTSITMNAYSTATGRMLARNGQVVMTSTNIIKRP